MVIDFNTILIISISADCQYPMFAYSYLIKSFSDSMNIDENPILVIYAQHMNSASTSHQYFLQVWSSFSRTVGS